MKVIIVGGGWSGCAAAVAAQKQGAAVTLIERADMLLGTGLVGGIMRNNGRYTAAEGWGAPVLIPGSKGSRPDVAIDPNGNAIAVWNQLDGARPQNIRASRFTPTGGWTTAELIEQSDDGYDPSNARVAFDAIGDAIAIWNQCGYADCPGNDIWANRFTLGGGWGTAEVIEGGAGSAGSPEIGFDANRDATVVWHQSDGSIYRIWAVRYE